MSDTPSSNPDASSTGHQILEVLELLMMSRRSFSVAALVAAFIAGAPTAARAHGPYWGYPGPYPYYYPPVGYPGYAAVVRPHVGLADLDVEPEEAQVYIQGKLIGTADDFDGFPGYLALRTGKRVIVMRHPGYADLKVNLRIVPGGMTRVRMDMKPLAPH